MFQFRWEVLLTDSAAVVIYVFKALNAFSNLAQYRCDTNNINLLIEMLAHLLKQSFVLSV